MRLVVLTVCYAIERRDDAGRQGIPPNSMWMPITMALTSCSYSATAILDAWSSREWADGVQIETLPDLETLAVRTRNSLYQITVLSPRTGEILVRGGQFYRSPTKARLAGASLGGSFLKQRSIYVGFCMELQDEGLTIVTTAVHSIRRVGHDRVQ
jgi:hypothetical protein